MVKQALLGVAVACGALAPVRAHAQDVGLPIGTAVAPVTVQDLDGNAVTLAPAASGKPTVLEFWATWCPLCAELEPQLRSIATHYGDRVDVVIVAVGVNQNPRSIKRHIAKHAMPGRIVYDARGAATRAFMAPATSYVVITDASGKVAYTGQGTEQQIEAALARLLPR